MKNITVKELRQQLEKLEAIGMGNCKVWYRDYSDMDWTVEQGIYDTDENNVVLG